MSIAVLAGLGNPGEEYAVARWTPPALAPVLLVKPLTYVNDSGRCLRRVCDYFRHPVPAVAVVFDDLTMPVGRLKISVTGSAGGHNGVQSLLDHLGTGFVRFRIGIGPRTPPQIDLKDFVLGRFPPTDRQTIDQQISNYLAGLDLLFAQGVEPAMNQLNRRPSSANDPDQAQV